MAMVQSNGVWLSYLREGTGPPVLLLHGYLFGAEWWRPQIDALSDRFDVVAVDLRGQRGSETTDRGYDHWNQAEDIHGLIEELGIKPAHLVGLSMGGFIGMRLALSHPDDMRSLVLMDTSAGPENPEAAQRNSAMYAVAEAGELEAVLPALPPIFFADDFIVDHRDVVDRWLDGLRTVNVAGLARAGRANDDRDDIRPRLAEIRIPTLVVHGENDLPIPLECGRDIAAGIRGARLETVSGGHQSNVDRPEETSRLIREFLLGLSVPAGQSADARH